MPLPSWSELDRNKRRGAAFKGAALTMASGVVRLLLSVSSAIVLGRLLGPEDFGLMGMILPLIGLVALFADGGISFYTLQTKSITHRKLSQLFWLTALIACFMTLLFCVSSPLIASFYNEPRLQNLALVVSSSFLLTIFISQHNALVKRFFKNELYSIAEVCAAVASFTVSVSLAILGWGYWALASIPLARHATHALVIWSLTKWVPSFVAPSKRQSSVALYFGWHMSFSMGFGFIAKNIDKVLVGWKFGAEPLGYYAMAYSIMMLPFLQVSTPVGGTIVPYLKAFRKDEPEFNKRLNQIQYLLSLCIVPVMLWAALFSETLLTTVLGEKWLESAEIFSILALSAICMAQSLLISWGITSIGNPKLLTNWSLFFVPLTISSYFVGLAYGPIGIAFSFLAVNFLQVFMLPLFAGKYTIINARTYFISVFKIFMASGLVLGVVVVISMFLPGGLISLIATFIVMILVLLPSFWLFNPGVVGPILNKGKTAINKFLAR